MAVCNNALLVCNNASYWLILILCWCQYLPGNLCHQNGLFSCKISCCCCLI